MAKKAGVPPTSRRIFLSGLGSQAGRQLGSFVYISPVLRRTKSPTQAQIYAQQTLAVAARFVSLAQAWEYQTAKDLAGDSGYTWKDQLVAGFFGTALEFTDTDGVLWQGRRVLAAEIQTLLDSISSTPGSILVRTANGWAALYSGTNGYVLTMNADTGLPDWLAVPSDETVGFSLEASTFGDANILRTATLSTAEYAHRCVHLPQGVTITGVRTFCAAALSTSRVTPALIARNATTITKSGALLATGPTLSGVVAGFNSMPFTAPYTTTVDDEFYFGMLSHTTLPATVEAQDQVAWSSTAATSWPSDTSSITWSFSSTNPWFWLY